MTSNALSLVLVTLAMTVLFLGCGNKKPPVPPSSLVSAPPSLTLPR